MCVLSLSLALGSTIGLATATTVGTGIATATGITSIGAAALGAAAIDLAVLGVAGAAAGGTLSAIQAANNADYQRYQAKEQERVARENARLSGIRAEQVELEANQKRRSLLLDAIARRGSMRATLASQGVVLGAGSAADYEADVMDMYELDRRNLDYDTASESWQNKMEQVNFLNQANQFRTAAGQFGQQKTTGLIGGLIGTVGNTAGAAMGAAGSLLPFAKSKNADKLGQLATNASLVQFML